MLSKITRRFRRKPEPKKEALGYFKCGSIKNFPKTNKEIIPETKQFIEDLYEWFTPLEKICLEVIEDGIKYKLSDLLLMRFGHRHLKYNPKRSLILAVMASRRERGKFVDYCWRSRGTDEILDRFESLFLEEGQTIPRDRIS